MRTLFLNPPSFEGFDGGASSRWPASREIESYWYPVWLCYPAGMLPDSKVVDAPPHKISIEQTVRMAKDFELLVLFTSTPGFHVDVKMAEMMKDTNPKLKVAFVGPPVTVEPEKIVAHVAGHRFRGAPRVRLPDRRLCQGKPLEELPGVSFRKNGHIVNNPEGPVDRESGRVSLGDQGLSARSGCEALQRSVPAEPVYLALHIARMPGACVLSACGRKRTRAIAGGCVRPTTSRVKWRYAKEAFPYVKEIFFDDDTFNYQKARTIELCKKLKPLNFTWSCTSRVTTDYDTLKAMKEAGCRLLIVGYESGDQQILKNIKKGATIDMALRFTENCKKLGLIIHGDFIIGLPGETRESIRKTIDFAKRIDTETIQVSLAHPYPGTEFYDYVKKNNLITIDSMTDEPGTSFRTSFIPVSIAANWWNG